MIINFDLRYAVFDFFEFYYINYVFVKIDYILISYYPYYYVEYKLLHSYPYRLTYTIYISIFNT